MSHWAELDQNNKVIRVLVGDNNDPAGDEGYSWLVQNLRGTWVKTSYNATMRKNFAGVGFTYDETLDAFVAPKCHEQAILDETTAQWNCENEAHNVTLS
jgi:hypothetical protein